MTLAERGVGVDGVAAAAQNDGVAGLEAEGGDVHRHVGPALVDDAHNSERNAPASDLEAVGHGSHLKRLADRIGQRGDAANVGRDGVQTLRVERHTVEVVFGKALLPSGVEVELVRVEYGALILGNAVGDVEQRLGSDVSGGLGEFARGGLGGLSLAGEFVGHGLHHWSSSCGLRPLCLWRFKKDEIVPVDNLVAVVVAERLADAVGAQTAYLEDVARIVA